MSGITCGAGMSMNPETSPSASDIAANEQHNSPGTHALTNHTMADHLLSAAHQQAAQQMLKKSRSDDPYLIGKAAAFGTARTASTENTTVLPSTSSSSSIRSEKPPRVGSYHSTASSTHSSHHAHQNMSQQPPPHYHGIPVSRSSDTTSVYKSSKQYHAMGGSQEFDHDHHTFATATTASATISYSTDEVDHVNSDVSEVGMEVVMDDSNNNSNPEQAREQQILSLLDRSKSKERHHRTAPSQPYVTHSFPAGKHTFTIDQRYHFIRVIGSGAYGVVISAKDSQTNADIAIKMVPRAFHDEVDAKRILREIKLLKHFQHENIVTIMDMMPPGANYVEDYHDVYMITDLMETDLHRIIYSKQKLSLDHVQYFVYQVLRGLKYIHSCNVLHRDLKPSNLLVNSNCDLKICDFGLARGVYDSNAMDGPNGSLLLTEYVVTRWYRAPEIMLACHEYSKPIDIWSVGCIFAELILRKPYFPGDDYIDQLTIISEKLGKLPESDLDFVTSDKAKRFMKKLPNKPLVPLSQQFPSATPEALDLLRKMLSIHPKKRLTVEEALAHPFFRQLHSVEDEPVSEHGPFDFRFENEHLHRKRLQELIWEEVGDFRPWVLPVKPSRANIGGSGNNLELSVTRSRSNRSRDP